MTPAALEPLGTGGVGIRRVAPESTKTGLAHEIRADIAALTLPDGSQMQVWDWEDEFIAGAFSDGVTRIGLSIPRKNGKTEAVSAIAVSGLIGHLAQRNGLVLLVASSLEQGRIAFTSIRAMLQPLIDRDKRRFRIADTANRAEIEDRRSGCRLRVISSDPDRAFGLRPHLVIGDEVASWPGGGERMVAALVTSVGGRECRFLMTGTRPIDNDHVFERWLRTADYSYVRHADPNADPLDVETYRACNPSWDHLPFLRKAIERDIAEATVDPNALPRLRALRGNLGGADTAEAYLLDPVTWTARCEGDAEREGRYALGVDLGKALSMSAVVGYWPHSGAVRALGAFPRRPGLLERGTTDGVGELYQRLNERGELLLLGEEVVDVGRLIAEAVERWGKPNLILSDRFRQADLRQAVVDAGIPPTKLVYRGLGTYSGDPDINQFRRSAIAGDIHAGTSLLLRHSLSESRTTRDHAGNEKLTRRRASSANDAAVALVLAVAEGARHHQRATPEEIAPLRLRFI